MEISHLPKKDTYTSSGENKNAYRKEIEEVDLSRILEYVSPHELERFENAQFKIEAEAEAEVLRQEAKELALRRLEKNDRASGAGKGSRMLSGLGLDPEAPARGRPRGRGRGRGRASWRGRGAMTMHSRSRDEETQHDLEPIEALHRDEEDIQRIIAETESEEEDSEEGSRRQASPNLMRSAFVANSALPVSPVVPHRRLSTLSMIQRGHPEVPDIGDSDIDGGNDDARSMSSVAVQLQYENHFRGQTVAESEDETLEEDGHRSKRRRTASTASDRRMPTTRMSSSYHPRRTQPRPSHESENAGNSSNDSIPADPHSASRRLVAIDHDNDTVHVQSHPNAPSTSQEDSVEEEDSEAEEYAIEAILEHYYNGQTKYYLVKWEGYEDSHDWLPEERLAGAAELVAEYNARIRRRAKRG